MQVLDGRSTMSTPLLLLSDLAWGGTKRQVPVQGYFPQSIHAN